MIKERQTTASQKTVSRWLNKILIWYGYDSDNIVLRCKDINSQNQTFLPDIVAANNKKKFVYEIETTVNNNTLFKSLASLMKYISENSMKGITVNAFIVVPKGRVYHAEKCLSTTIDLINYFATGSTKTYNINKIKIISFEMVAHVYHGTRSKTVGRPLTCNFV